jgi:hypothetical protein
MAKRVDFHTSTPSLEDPKNEGRLLKRVMGQRCVAKPTDETLVQ